ncbi:L10-interacting MYB domain-containing protein-like [Hordeum vulgare]|nr:L10-interacting MYB domain-containing protein-like [Hordeum vulgare]
MELKNSATGLGWNDKMGTIEADDSWWDIHLKKYPGHAKWRYMGPPNLKEMDVMFENAHVTGETASIPGEISSSSDDDAIAEVKESEDLGTPLKSFKKKGGQGKTLGKRKSKSHVEDEEDKNPFLRAYKQTLGKINSRVSEGSANHVTKVTAPTMGEVLNLMVECGAEEGTSLFHTATKIVMKPEYRELFMLIKTKEGRLQAGRDAAVRRTPKQEPAFLVVTAGSPPHATSLLADNTAARVSPSKTHQTVDAGSVVVVARREHGRGPRATRSTAARVPCCRRRRVHQHLRAEGEAYHLLLAVVLDELLGGAVLRDQLVQEPGGPPEAASEAASSAVDVGVPTVQVEVDAVVVVLGNQPHLVHPGAHLLVVLAAGGAPTWPGAPGSSSCSPSPP